MTPYLSRQSLGNKARFAIFAAKSISMSMPGPVYENQRLNGNDFSGMDLTGATFRKCTFSNVTFKGAVLLYASFISCKKAKTGALSFDDADMNGAKLDKCSFQAASFTRTSLINATISNTDLSDSNLIACRFNNSFIDGLDVRRCNMNMATFIGAQIMAIVYKPVRNIPYMRGLSPFRRKHIQHNTIFISGNQHLEFTAYCNSEFRKDKLFSSANSLGPAVRPFAFLLLGIFGLLTDFGQSFTRWFLCVTAIVAAFAAGTTLIDGIPLPDSVMNSMLAFFGFGEIAGGYTYPYVIESVIGYFMLGMLISLLTTKLSIN